MAPHAGVWLAAHHELFEVSDDFPDSEDILETVTQERDLLLSSIEPLFEHLTEGDTETTREALLKQAEDAEDELSWVEPQAAARLLEELS